MGLEELRGYLTSAVSPEELELFDSTFNVLELFQVEDYMSIFSTLIGEQSIYGDQHVIDSIKQTLFTITADLVARHGIELQEEANQTQVNDILLGCQQIQDFELRQAIAACLVADESDEEIFAEVLSTVTGKDVSHFLTGILTVDSSLIDALRSEFKLEADAIVAADEKMVSDRMDLLGVIARKTKSDLWAAIAMVNLEMFVTPFDDLFNLFIAERKEEVANAESEDAMQELATQICAIAVISAEGAASFTAKVAEHMEQLYTDFEHISLFNKVVQRVNQEYFGGK